MKTKIVNFFLVLFFFSNVFMQFGCKKDSATDTKKTYVVKYTVKVVGSLTEDIHISYKNGNINVSKTQTEWTSSITGVTGDNVSLSANVKDSNEGQVSVLVSIAYNDQALCSEYSGLHYGLANSSCNCSFF